MKTFKNDDRQAELKTIAAIPDDQIDLSDIPELLEQQLRRGVRGKMHSVKKLVTHTTGTQRRRR